MLAFNSKLRYGWCGTSYHATCNGPTHQPAFGVIELHTFHLECLCQCKDHRWEKGWVRPKGWCMNVCVYNYYICIYIYTLTVTLYDNNRENGWNMEFFQTALGYWNSDAGRVEDVKPQDFNLLEVKEKGRIQSYETLKLENFIRWCPSLGSQHTVDGSEIPWPTTVGMVLKPL